MRELADLFLKHMEDRFAASENQEELLSSFKYDYRCKPDNRAVLNMLYKYYVLPNEERFRQNYLSNLEHWNTVKYETCAYDFVPLTEGEYFVLSKETQQFCGTFTIGSYKGDKRAEKCFSSILIADYQDIKDILTIALEKRWMNVYIVCNEATPQFASYFKLDDFSALFPSNTKIFETTEEMRQYFLDHPDAYLPRKIFAQNTKFYEELVEDIHNIRVQSGVPSNNVFLSICIPSYNRGERAIETVRQALTIGYDAEIEVILVNNGSTVGVEFYEQIRDFTDSRLRFYEYADNGGYVEIYLKCLKKAHGCFALMLSDEDSLAVENIDEMLDYLNLSRNVGVCSFEGITYVDAEKWPVRKQRVLKKGMEAIEWALNDIAYFSGLCYNMNCIKSAGIFDQVENYRNNYYINYVQCVLSGLLASKFDVSNSGINGWYRGEEEKVGGNMEEYSTDKGLWSYALPESRIKQERGVMNFLGDLLEKRELEEIFIKQVAATFGAISSYYRYRGDELIHMYCWNDICVSHYQNCLQIIQDLKDKFEDISLLISQIDKIFFNWLICKREQRLHTPEENLLPSLRAQVAKYYYDKGASFEKINFEKIDENLEDWVKDFLAERS